MLGFLFMDIIGGGFKNLWSGIKSKFTNMIFSGTSNNTSESALILASSSKFSSVSQLISEYKQTQLTSIQTKQLEVVEEAAQKTSIILRKEALDTMEQIAPHVDKLLMTVKGKGFETFEKSTKKIFQSLEETMKSQGTLDLYNATIDMNLHGLDTHSIVILFIIMSLFSVGFSSLG